jgi:hypothetical protein
MKPKNQEKLHLLRELWDEYQSYEETVDIQGVKFRAMPAGESVKGKRCSYLINRIDQLLWDLLPEIVKDNDALQDGQPDS